MAAHRNRSLPGGPPAVDRSTCDGGQLAGHSMQVAGHAAGWALLPLTAVVAGATCATVNAGAAASQTLVGSRF